MAGIHIKAVYLRTRSAGAEDVAVTTHDLFIGDSDDRPSTAQMDTIAAAFATYWGALTATNGIIASNVSLSELRFYIGYDGDGTPGQVDYVKTYTLPGTVSGGMCPPQVACSVTEITDSRRHWGRFYIPGVSSSSTVLASDGTLASAKVTIVANAVETMYKAWGAITDVTPIVWTRTSHPIEYLAVAPPRWRPTWAFPTGTTYSAPAALAVQSIRVDEILDIQRRRRYQATQIRQTRQLA